MLFQSYLYIQVGGFKRNMHYIQKIDWHFLKLLNLEFCHMTQQFHSLVYEMKEKWNHMTT